MQRTFQFFLPLFRRDDLLGFFSTANRLGLSQLPTRSSSLFPLLLKKSKVQTSFRADKKMPSFSLVNGCELYHHHRRCCLRFPRAQRSEMANFLPFCLFAFISLLFLSSSVLFHPSTICRIYLKNNCLGCNERISSEELVMRTTNNVFHLKCFTCVVCGAQLKKGEQYVVKQSQLFCRNDYEKEVEMLKGFNGT